jgi:hypothetical protein
MIFLVVVIFWYQSSKLGFLCVNLLGYVFVPLEKTKMVEGGGYIGNWENNGKKSLETIMCR